ncbi:MAG: hypothetical protein J6A59_08525, partial [Lachnospiraceae bacterium]|nr:hypothetical protein [Lachnospiraceae bacterium]
MSNTKDKRIKKFNRKRIWPSIVGLFIISVLFTAIIAASIGLYTMNLIDRKLYDSYEISYKISEYMMLDGVTDVSQDELEDYIQISDSVLAVTVLDDEEKAIWTNNSYSVNLDDSLTYINDANLFESGYEIIIHLDEGSI